MRELFNAKAILEEQHTWGIRELYTFPIDIISKVNVIARLEFELAYFEVVSLMWREIDYNPKTGLYFRTCEDGAGWHLIPYRNKSCSEFFSQACKNWHITWGNNLGPDWPPLARGSKFHPITHPPGRFLLSPR